MARKQASLALNHRQAAAEPQGGSGTTAVRECVGCHRIGLPNDSVPGGYVWMCRAALEARHGTIAGPASPNLCPICIDAIG
jgi:hypothetical protein